MIMIIVRIFACGNNRRCWDRRGRLIVVRMNDLIESFERIRFEEIGHRTVFRIGSSDHRFFYSTVEDEIFQLIDSSFAFRWTGEFLFHGRFRRWLLIPRRNMNGQCVSRVFLLGFQRIRCCRFHGGIRRRRITRGRRFIMMRIGNGCWTRLFLDGWLFRRPSTFTRCSIFVVKSDQRLSLMKSRSEFLLQLSRLGDVTPNGSDIRIFTS